MRSYHRSLQLLFVATLLLCVFSTKTYSQQFATQTPRYVSMCANTNGYYESLPPGYNPSGSQTYPLILFIQGMGEMGDGSPNSLPAVLWHGIPRLINQGVFPSSFTVNGQTSSFIIISPQFVNWPSTNDIDQILNYLTQQYRVDLTRIYLTGLSMGGGVAWDYAGGSAAYANRVAAIVPICGASWPSTQKCRTIAEANIAVWATNNDGDPVTSAVAQTLAYVNGINVAPAPNPAAKASIFPAAHHDAWTKTYDPNFTENGLNIYQWMLQYRKGFTPPPVNQAPLVNAGADQTITSLVNSVTLNGSAQDADGSVVSYNWSKVFGPSQFTINSPNQAQTTVSNLTGGTYTFRLRATDNLGATGFDDVNITLPYSLPATIEAENYVAMSGVQTEYTGDATGGFNVGWIEQNDWMDYYVNVPSSGNYTVKFRIATPNNGAQLQLRRTNGTVLTTLALPNTGGWQSWQTVTTTVSLTAGIQNLRVFASGAAGWNFNWMEFASGGGVVNQPPVANAGPDQTITLPANSVQLNGSGSDPDGTVSSYSWSKVSGPANGTISNSQIASPTLNNLVEGTYVYRLTVTDNSGATATDDINIVVNPAAAPPPPPPSSGTIRIEAENFTAQSGIFTENTWDAGGGLNVGWIDNGDWMDYGINPATTGNYAVKLRVATPNNGAQLQIRKSDGTLLTTVNIPNTGTYQTWQTIDAVVSLTQGAQTLRIVSTATPGWNINWMEFSGTAATPPPATVTTKIEAEHYTNMSGIATENTWDAGGGQNVGWIDQGDWMDYSYNAPSTGTYSVKFRVATPNNGAQLQLRKADGTVLATVNIPNTGGYQNWQTVSVNITLTAGVQTLRVVSTAASFWNINWMEFTSSGASLPPPSSPTTTKIEAENWSAMNGVFTETAWGDQQGGNLNVGWIDNGDWMDYSYNAPASGSYTLRLRIATPNSNAQLQVRRSDGTILSTVNLPNTGGYQSWQTISTTINLAQGLQTIRLISSNNDGWNINWLELTGPLSGSTTMSTASAEVENTADQKTASNSVSVFPNPAQDKVVVRMDNELTGTVQIQILNTNGMIIKEMNIQKPNAGIIQSYISLSNFKAGVYFIRMKMKDWTETKQIIKQ